MILHLTRSGHVAARRSLSSATSGAGNLTALAGSFPPLSAVQQLGFGRALAAVGDVDGDGCHELAVVVQAHAALVLVSFSARGAVRAMQPVRLSGTATSTNGPSALLKVVVGALAAAGDVDGDAVPDILLGGRGAVSLLTLTAAGVAKEVQQLNTSADLLFQGLDQDGMLYFGNALAAVADRNGDGTVDLVVGACGDVSSFQVMRLVV